MLTMIRNKIQYRIGMQTIEGILEKTIQKGGFHRLSKKEGN